MIEPMPGVSKHLSCEHLLLKRRLTISGSHIPYKIRSLTVHSFIQCSAFRLLSINDLYIDLQQSAHTGMTLITAVGNREVCLRARGNTEVQNR